MPIDYLRDPKKIEQASFAQICRDTHFGTLDREQQQVAMRIVHTCGLPEIVQQLRITPDAIEAGLQALRLQSPILCDAKMVAAGLTRRYLDNPTHCYIDCEAVAQRATACGQTRSMAAVDRWVPDLQGALVVIGNAPTALFRLIELLQQPDAIKPALIIGVPVGFIGAAESKQLLWELRDQLGVGIITLQGRQGGSAIASAIVNALARMRHNIYF